MAATARSVHEESRARAFRGVMRRHDGDLFIDLKRALPIKIRLLLLIGCCLNGNEVSSCVDERRARVQPCHISLALMRALASEVRLSNRAAKTAAEEMTLPRMCRKSVPQRLKPSFGGLLWHG